MESISVSSYLVLYYEHYTSTYNVNKRSLYKQRWNSSILIYQPHHLDTMASWQYLDNDNSTVGLAFSSVAISSSVWLTLYNILLTYIAPLLMANALVGNALIVLLTLMPNVFSKQTSFTVRAYYVSFAIADIITVIFANLFSWLGVPAALLWHSVIFCIINYIKCN